MVESYVANVVVTGSNPVTRSIYKQMKKTTYKTGDTVKIKCLAGKAIPHVHVRLLKKHVIKKRKFGKTEYPGYIGWDAELINKNEIIMLKKRYQIPFHYPNDTKTFVFDDEIIYKIN